MHGQSLASCTFLARVLSPAHSSGFSQGSHQINRPGIRSRLQFMYPSALMSHQTCSRRYRRDHYLRLVLPRDPPLCTNRASRLHHDCQSKKRPWRDYPRPTMQHIRNMAEPLSVPLKPEFLTLMTAIDAEITIISVETGYTIAKAAFRVLRGDNQAPFRIEEVI